MTLACYDCRTNKYVIEEETAVSNADDAVEVSAENVASSVADAAAAANAATQHMCRTRAWSQRPSSNHTVTGTEVSDVCPRVISNSYILHIFIYISSPDSGPNMGSIGALLCRIRRWTPASPSMHGVPRSLNR